jgi:hypothetical protein
LPEVKTPVHAQPPWTEFTPNETSINKTLIRTTTFPDPTLVVPGCGIVNKIVGGVADLYVLPLSFSKHSEYCRPKMQERSEKDVTGLAEALLKTNQQNTYSV